MAKIDAATKAIPEPGPASYSAERYNPIITEDNPNICVQTKHDLKLRPINCAVAAGVTSSAVTSNAPTIFTILTTTAAVMILNNRPRPWTGSPCTLAARGSIVIASNPLRMKNNIIII